MIASQAFTEIAKRGIALVPAFDNTVWMASVDEPGTTISTKKRTVRQISATDSTPIGAVVKLIEILDAQSQQQELEEAYW